MNIQELKKDSTKFWHIIHAKSNIIYSGQLTHEEAWILSGENFDKEKIAIITIVFRTKDNYKKYLEKIKC